MSFTWGPLLHGGHLLLTPAAAGAPGNGYYYRHLLRMESLMLFVTSSPAAGRRFPIYLVDATDGITPETGEAAGQPQISKNGGAFANTTNTLTAIGNGSYYVELDANEVNTPGTITVRYKSANTLEFSLSASVVAFDLQDSTPTPTVSEIRDGIDQTPTYQPQLGPTLIQLDEATAARRRIYFQLIDKQLGTGQTGRVIGSFSPDITVLISKNGGATTAGAGTLTEVDSVDMPGLYYYEPTTGECDTLGPLILYIAESPGA